MSPALLVLPGKHMDACEPLATVRPFSTALALVMAVAFSSACQAAPEEIQVYLDDLRAPGKLGVDIHNNYTVSGRRTADYTGEQPPGKVYRLTPEFAYGLTPTVELGLYALSTRNASGRPHGDGIKARIKYIAPHDRQAGFFWGANLEVGRSSKRVSDTASNAQVKGIFGYRTGPWTVAVNPNMDWSLSRGGGPVTGEVDVKVAYALDATTQFGVESYNELGALKHVSASGANARSLYAVLDKDFGAFDLNAGVGRGLTTAADRWVVKFILGIDF